MNPRRAYTPKTKVTVEDKRSGVFRMLFEIELALLTPDRLRMIAARVYSPILQPAAHGRLLAEITNTVAHRRAREGFGGH